MNAFLNRFLYRLCLLPVLLLLQIAAADEWKPLEKDGLHDPANPAIEALQDPAEALRVLPPDTAGNRVDWVRALENGYIEPRSHLRENPGMEVLDSNVLFRNTGEMPYVLFPHKPHTQWLACGNCHDHLFKTEVGSTEITMLSILQGEHCGRCHGAVSFPLTECNRCHNTPRK